MVYKKYIIKGGKRVGPYYYESYREGNSVRKKYIGGEKEYQNWLGKTKKNEKDVKQFIVISKKTFNIGVLLFLLSLIALIFVIGWNFGSFINIASFSFTGFAVSENASESDLNNALLYGDYENEEIVEQFDKDKVDLEIKEPPKFAGEAVSENKNKRMEFDSSEGKIRLYFDLMNYSEFVDEVSNLVEEDKLQEIEAQKEKEKKADENKIYTPTEKTIETITNETSEVVEENNITQENPIEEVVEEPIIEAPVETPAQEVPAEQPVAEPVSEVPITGGVVAVEKGKGVLYNLFKYPVGFFIKVFEKTGITGKAVDDTNASEEVVVSEELLNTETTTEETQTTSENNSNDLINNIDNSDSMINNNISSGEIVNEESSVSQSEQLTNSETISESTTEEIQDKVEELDEIEIKNIEEQAIVAVSDFEVNVTIADENKYKWGYKVKLNSLNFMAKIDVTSDKNISILSDDSLQIGNQLLSFNDLVKAGYTIRIEKPALEINISDDTTSSDETTVEIISEETTATSENTSNNIIEDNISNEEIVSEEQLNESSEQEIVEEQPIVENSTPAEEPVGITGNLIKGFAKTIYLFAGLTGRVVDGTTGFAVEQTEIADVEYKNTITIYIEKDFNEKTSSGSSLTDETTNTNTETLISQETASQETTNNLDINNTNNVVGEGRGLENSSIVEGVSEQAETSLITGNVIADEEITFASDNITTENSPTSDNNLINNINTGESLAGVSENSGLISEGSQLNDLYLIKYEDIDGDGKISVGDIIELDPTLTYIYISKAEHLDAERNYVSDIYNSVKEQDGNWSEVINNNEFVRVTFEKNLTNQNDITFYGRAVDNCSINPSSSIIINNELVSCDIYNKKKRIDELKKILFTNFLSLQFLILIFIPKKLKIRGLLGE